MKLHILSDLHIEFADFAPPATDADVVILAGDIGVGMSGLEWASSHFSEKPVVYVPGNHEYYDHDLSLIDDLKSHAPSNIHVLNDAIVELGGIRFICSTLWTDFNLYGEGEKYFSVQRARHLMEDFSSIRNGDRTFSPDASIRLHENSKIWMFSAIVEAFEGKTVVVTHHAPSSRSIARKFASDPLNPAFASGLEALMDSGRPTLWVHGHTHDAFDYQIYDTRVVCNPRGYPNEAPDNGFLAGLTIEV